MSWTVDDGVSRVKLRESGGRVQLAVGNTGAADGSLKAAVSIDPASGNASFPLGVLFQAGEVGFRNRIINGKFDIWQRGTSFTLTAGANYVFAADRWYLNNWTSVSMTFSKVSAPSGFLGAFAINCVATAVPNNYGPQFVTRLESQLIRDLDSKRASCRSILMHRQAGVACWCGISVLQYRTR